jgi:hypothetical protein
MARPRLALRLATAFLAVAGARAAAQPVPPPNSATLPDPAAILLPPVANADPDSIAPVRRSALPAHEPAATMRLDADDAVPVRAADYDRARITSTSYSDPDSARRKAADDPFGYLTDGFTRRSAAPVDEDRGLGDRLGDKIDDLLGKGKRTVDGGRRFESDRAFANFISPMTNPFYFEDPRSLTEVRAIGLFQGIPGDQGTFRGGNAMFFGGQARLAFTERWSLVVNKVGVSLFNPGSESGLPNRAGLSELWIGPKYVIIRDPEHKTLLSAGATFQIPLGSGGVYQDTGRLSVVPYVTAAQKLMSTAWGTFNGMAAGGYSFGTNRDRSDFFFASAHVDFDVMNKQQFFPLAELNWFGYTTDGQARAFGVEGRDLANIGAANKGANLVTWALGGRYRSKNSFWELGAAFEGPLFGPRGLFNYRFTVDIIWRY